MGKQDCRPTALQALEQEHSILHITTQWHTDNCGKHTCHDTRHSRIPLRAQQVFTPWDPTVPPSNPNKKPTQPRGQDRQTQPQQKARRLGTLAVAPTLFQLVSACQHPQSLSSRAHPPGPDDSTADWKDLNHTSHWCDTPSTILEACRKLNHVQIEGLEHRQP